jgi:hypothetical protein
MASEGHDGYPTDPKAEAITQHLKALRLAEINKLLLDDGDGPLKLLT